MLSYLLIFLLFRLVILIVQLGLLEVVLSKLELLLLPEGVFVPKGLKQGVFPNLSTDQDVLCLFKLVVSLLDIPRNIKTSPLQSQSHLY